MRGWLLRGLNLPGRYHPRMNWIESTSKNWNPMQWQNGEFLKNLEFGGERADRKMSVCGNHPEFENWESKRREDNVPKSVRLATDNFREPLLFIVGRLIPLTTIWWALCRKRAKLNISHLEKRQRSAPLQSDPQVDGRRISCANPLWLPSFPSSRCR